MPAPLISIAICTFERPELLERALLSVLAQDAIDAGDIEIVVVDNSDSGSARAVIDALNLSARPRIRYLQAHPANISVARNAAIAASAGTWIAFLDDDLAVEPGWLDAIRRAVARYEFDAMFGAVSAAFADPESTCQAAEQAFTRMTDMPAGARLHALKRSSRQPFPLSTANCILRRAALDALDSLFDPRFGQSGGEDFHLFLRMEQRGARFGWLPEAVCVESVPAHRCDAGYLARRFFAGSQAFAAAQIATSRFPRLKAVLIGVKAWLQLALMELRRFGGRGAGDPHFALRRASIRGKIFWRDLHPVYADEASALKRTG